VRREASADKSRRLQGGSSSGQGDRLGEARLRGGATARGSVGEAGGMRVNVLDSMDKRHVPTSPR